MGTVANLAIRVGVNAADVQKGLSGVESSVSGFSGRLAAVGTAVAGAFSINAIGHAAEQAIHTASRIADMAERVGISAEAVQRLEFAASQSGSSFDSAATSIRVMADRLNDGKLPKALTDMGLSVQQLSAMTPDQAFITIANAIKQIPNPLLQSATAVDIFGRGAQAILPAIKGGMVEIGNQAPIMSNALVASLDATGDKWAAMQLQINNLRAQALSPLLSAFLSMPTSLQTVAAGIATFLPSIEGIGIAILAAGGPTAAFGMLSTAAGAVAAFFTTTLPLAFGAIITFLGPQGLIALAVIALGAIWYTWGDDITAVVQRVYGAIKTWLVDSWASIGPAISAGVGTVVEFFTDAMNALVFLAQNAYTNIKGWLADKWAVIATAASTTFQTIGTAFSTMKDALVAYAQQTYEGVKAWLVDKFTAIVESIRAKIDAVKGYFKGMYDAVVGGSYVPDMIAGIQNCFGQLGAAMVNPAQTATSAVEGFFQSMAQKATGWIDGLLKKIPGIGGALSQVFSGMGGLGGILGKMPGFGKMFGGAASGGLGGMAGGGGGGLGLTGALSMAGPYGMAAAAAIAGAKALWGHFSGGEEAKLVNPARDAFGLKLRGQYGGSNSDAVTRALEQAGLGGERASILVNAFNTADTMQEFNAATSAIESALASAKPEVDQFTGTVNTATDGLVAGFGQLTLAVQQLTVAASIAASALMPGGGGAPKFTTPGEVLGAAPDAAVFASDTQGGTSVTVQAGTIIGNPDELADMVLNSLEGGGDAATRYRAINGQLTES